MAAQGGQDAAQASGRSEGGLDDGREKENEKLQIPVGAVGIEIRNSSIKTIPTDAFSAYGATLEELNITGCGVEQIEPNAFRGLGRLRVLGLIGNRIRVLDASWLQDLTSLEALIAWRNRIAEIDARLYDLLPNLEYWDIAYNELNFCLPPDMLRRLTRLRRIHIAGNPWLYRCRPSMTWYLGKNHIHFVQDWGANDRLIEDCLVHELHADVDDAVLQGCVDRKLVTVDSARALADLSEHVRELARKVTELQADVDALKKNIH
ncbi:slit homolog 2 protein isoform X2 [Ooceraea biroi]|uniref:slit homolog 2 protein isoform X2 n=1 Tax=Ooceraea biroi TaxID=2015173 RepID=UPI0005BBF881|nr:slit homolog 2 protein isoform X2 [Ooceraea biroi]XP_026825756.1 slit homolog 2 protein isoform X2 [Ooceraea biroi]